MLAITPLPIYCAPDTDTRRGIAGDSLVGIVLVGGRSWPAVDTRIQGYRMITGQSFIPSSGQGSMMAMVTNMARVAVIVTVATSMSIFGGSLQTFLSANGTLGSEISQLVAGTTSPISGIDQNMAETQIALAAIDAVQVPPGDTETADAKTHAMFLAGFGTSSPPMAAGAMLLLYQFAMAMVVGFGPLFILCLIFDQTKERRRLFQPGHTAGRHRAVDDRADHLRAADGFDVLSGHLG
jgi:hypothetical protein